MFRLGENTTAVAGARSLKDRLSGRRVSQLNFGSIPTEQWAGEGHQPMMFLSL